MNGPANPVEPPNPEPSPKPLAVAAPEELALPRPHDLSQPLLGPVTATILATFQHAVYLSFNHQEKEETAVFCPGRMFINGSTNLLSFAKSKEVLRQVLREKMEVEVMVQPFATNLEVVVCTSGEEVVVVRPEAKTEVEARLANKADKTVSKSVGWGVTLLYKGEEPTMQQLNSAGHVFQAHQEGWNRVVDRVHRELFGENNEEDDKEKVEDNWFLVHENGINPSNIPEIYPTNTKSGIKGVIKEIHRPFGGLVDVGARNGGLLKFHRGVLIKESVRLGLTEVLEENASLGKSVLVDISENIDEDGKEILAGIKGSKIATAVYIGDVPEPVEDHPEIKSHGLVGHKIRVVELYPDSEGKVVSGLGTIQVSQIIRSGGAAASMVGEWVTFKAEDLFFYGVQLGEKVDLSYLLGVGDEIHCQLKMLDTKLGRAQFVVKIGWLSKVAGSVRGLLLPECGALFRWCERKGVEWAKIEDVVLGKVDSKANTATENLAVGTVYDLEPAENNETVSKGLIKIEVGVHKGKMVRFNRSKASLFGLSLENADLLYVVRPHDQVFCEVSGIGDYPSGQYVSQKVHFHQISTDKIDTIPMESMDEEERTDFLFWLSIHNNKFKDFKDVLSGKSTSRYFIPFPRDPLPGRVVCFDPVRTNKYGCTSGTILLEASSLNLEVEDLAEGQIGVSEMKDVKVTFHRACFWVYGRKMAKADLSYVVQPNQRVMVECRKITADDRKLHSSLPMDIDYRATVIWIGPSRPRNDREDPNRNDTGIFQWLGKRGLNIAQFTKLVEGRLPPHSPHELDHNNFFLPPVRGDGASQTSMDLISRAGQPELMPVLRHGPVIAHILDTAIASQGPADPRLFTLLENDEMAQVCLYS